MKKIGIGITFLLLLIGFAAAWWLNSSSPPGLQHMSAKSLPSEPIGRPQAKQVEESEEAEEANGETIDADDEVSETDVDGDFLIDSDGHLIVTEDARHIFDYFLSLTPEDSKEQTRQRLQQYIESTLSDPARTEALQLLERYLQFKHGVAELNAEVKAGDWVKDADFSSARERLQDLKALRRRFFSDEETGALFGVEEAYDEFSLRRLEILQNKTLSDVDKLKQIQLLRESLPDTVRQSVEPQLQLELDEKTQTLRDAGAPDTEIRRLREQMVGPDAAARLEVLDKEQQAWSDRLELFRAEKRKIAEDPVISDDVKQKMIESLLEARFSELERQRVEAMDSE